MTHPLSLSLSGVQMVALDYDFTSRAPFTEDDVASLYPIVKQTNFRVSGNFTDIILRVCSSTECVC